MGKTIEVEQKKVVKKTVRRKKPIRQEHITQVPRVVEEIVPVPKIVQKSVDVPQVNYIDEFIDVPVTRNRHVPVLQKYQGSSKWCRKRWWRYHALLRRPWYCIPMTMFRRMQSSIDLWIFQ